MELEGRVRRRYVTCVVHLGPASVINCPKYQEWIAQFGAYYGLAWNVSARSLLSEVLLCLTRLLKLRGSVCHIFICLQHWAKGCLSEVLVRRLCSLGSACVVLELVLSNFLLSCKNTTLNSHIVSVLLMSRCLLRAWQSVAIPEGECQSYVQIEHYLPTSVSDRWFGCNRLIDDEMETFQVRHTLASSV